MACPDQWAHARTSDAGAGRAHLSFREGLIHPERIKCRGSSPELPFEVARGGPVANSNLGNGNCGQSFDRSRRQ